MQACRKHLEAAAHPSETPTKRLSDLFGSRLQQE
jgi:hypothetical protein